MTDDTGVREHLARILGSPGFQNSARLSRFLRYSVECKLKGEGGQIKEYLIGREVFDRNEDYDPRLDPIVRVEARRLRKKLDEFYAVSPPEPGGWTIELPKGSYAPEFRRATAPAAAPAPGMRRLWDWRYIAAIAVLIGLGLGLTIWYRSRPATQKPMLAVLPARWTWSTVELPDVHYDEELAELTAAELVKSDIWGVSSWPLIERYRNSGRKLGDIAAELHVSRTLLVAVRLEAGGFRVTGYVIDPQAGRKLGVYDVSARPLVTIEQRRQVAKELAAAVSKVPLHD